MALETSYDKTIPMGYAPSGNMGNNYSYNILTCLITVGDYDPDKQGLIDPKYIFNECVNIEINDSYETLTNTAIITLPREVLIELSNKGDSNQKHNKVLSESSSIFDRGQRITVAVGYDDNVKVLFDGFITNIMAKTPFSLQCEDFGWKLKKTPIEAFSETDKEKSDINVVLEKLLENSGISIHPLTKAMNLQIPPVRLSKSTSVGEILEQWKRNYGLMSFIKFDKGKPHLALSRTYFSTNSDKTLIDGESVMVPLIHFQDNVVKDNLTFTHLDKDSLAIEAISLGIDNTVYKAIITLNPTYLQEKAKFDLLDESGKKSAIETYDALPPDKRATTPAQPPDEFKVVNETKAGKKQSKTLYKNDQYQIKESIVSLKNVQDKVDVTKYNVRTYHEYNTDRESLLKNAKSRFKEISQTGIAGSVTIFGDFGLRAASMIRIEDTRNPEKNGLYVVSDVKTSFGVGGYRQTIKIPYKRGE